MKNNSRSLFPALQNTIEDILQTEIPEERKALLQVLIDFIQQRADQEQVVNLNFICTHNSRRSQFSQLWAQTAAFCYGISANCYSGGVEVTAFNERAVATVRRSGFKVNQEGVENPRYIISYSTDSAPLQMFSKLYHDETNTTSDFAAIMTCSHADVNCPYIPGAEARISLLYDDPKEFDGTAEEVMKYDERSEQIAAEIFYAFSKVNARLKLQNPKPRI